MASLLTRNRLAGATGVGLFGAYVASEYMEFLELRRDATVEKHLPPTDVAQRSNVLRIPKLLSAPEISALNAWHDENKSKFGSAGRTAANQAAAYHAGVWEVSYLHTSRMMQDRFPALIEKLTATALEAARSDAFVMELLKDVDLSKLRPRTIELHRVSKSGSLPFPHHHDTGSALTIDIMLSPPDDFVGGQLSTLESDGREEKLVSRPFESQGDAFVFLSHKYHCVQAVTAGERRVLVMELWDGVERTCGHRCERHQGPCGHTASSSFWRRAFSDIGSDL
ncbi:hypothetical protein M885DRAFT_583265 [Pelagophyceae sp. CCMP2097]|nr:hypothetical protein M885DRAFT_583265 [Pelagophyceae sp. CCMP2097]